MNSLAFLLYFSTPDPLRPPRLQPDVARHGEHGHDHAHGHGPAPRYAGPRRSVFTLGVAGPVGSGKTALVERLCKELWPRVDLAVITNDVYTHEDAEFLSQGPARTRPYATTPAPTSAPSAT